ncbi:MAG: DNA methylase [Planctomycetota bacterium]
MAQSPAHRFGQLIGEVLEAAIRGPLEDLCRRHGLYLDSKHPRAARKSRNKVAWKDLQGNTHDLDYVIELGGTEESLGIPKAFIEIAWRRYTKHSRNKAQEIQGAIIPLAETYRESHPFLGVVLAGVFTAGSLTQLRSHGFHLVYFPYQSVVSAFATAGIDAAFDEETPDRELAKKVARFKALSEHKKQQLTESLRQQHASELAGFIAALEVSLNRRVVTVFVLPLHGQAYEMSDAHSAIVFLQAHDQADVRPEFTRYEIIVRFNNGDEIRGQFQSKTTAIEFLATIK